MNAREKRSGSLVAQLSWRLALTTVCVMLLQAAIVGMRDYLNETDFHNNYVRREALRIARLVVEQRTGPGRIDGPLPSQYTGGNAEAYAFRVVEADGRVAAQHNAERLAPLVPWTDRPSPREDFWVRKLDGEQRMHVAGGLRVRRGPRHIWVELATFGDPDGTYVWSLVQDVLDDVWVPLLPLVLLTIVVATMSVRSSLRPLVTAARRADSIAAFERGDRLDVAALPAEASQFASAVNRLLDRVADLVAAQRFFIARAAHELRTPLSIMMLELGHLEGPSSKRLEADVVEMSEMVDRLLALSRLLTLEKPSLQPVEIATIVRELVVRMMKLAERHGHKLTFASHYDRTVRGDETSLRDAIRNLIDNAVRHTPPGTTIAVTIDESGAVVVEDSGPGLPPGSGQELLEPFRKGMESGSGAGLGLAIVQQAVQLHGGRLEIGRSALGGAKFRMVPRG